MFSSEIDDSENKFTKKAALSSPQNIFTDEILQKLNKAFDSIFAFGGGIEITEEEDFDSDSDED